MFIQYSHIVVSLIFLVRMCTSIVSSQNVNELFPFDAAKDRIDQVSAFATDSGQESHEYVSGQDQDLLLPAYFTFSGGIRGSSSQLYLIDNDTFDLQKNNTGNDLQEADESIELYQDFEELSQSYAAQNMLQLVNNERRKIGAKPLCLNRKLGSAAQLHTNDMITKNFFSHTGSDGSIVTTRVKRFSYKYNNLAENIAINGSVVGAHKAFMKSPGHRKNVLNPKLTQIGIAAQIGITGKYKGRTYVTQVFGQSNTERCG